MLGCVSRHASVMDGIVHAWPALGTGYTHVVVVFNQMRCVPVWW